MTRPNSATRLLALLQDEENAILSGDYVSLEQISKGKTELGRHLDAEHPDSAMLWRISQLARRNTSLLNAATAGIDDARRAIRGIKNTSVTETYDKNGTRHPMTGPQSGLERKL